MDPWTLVTFKSSRGRLNLWFSLGIFRHEIGREVHKDYMYFKLLLTIPFDTRILTEVPPVTMIDSKDSPTKPDWEGTRTGDRINVKMVSLRSRHFNTTGRSVTTYLPFTLPPTSLFWLWSYSEKRNYSAPRISSSVSDLTSWSPSLPPSSVASVASSSVVVSTTTTTTTMTTLRTSETDLCLLSY